MSNYAKCNIFFEGEVVMVNFASIDYMQLRERQWFVNVMIASKKVRAHVLNMDKIDEKIISNVKWLLNLCGSQVYDTMAEVIDDEFLYLNISEVEIKSKLPKLYQNWDIVRIKDGRAIFNIVEEFFDRYGMIYSHVKQDEYGCLYEEPEECYNILTYMYEQGILLYREQDIYGEEIEKYRSSEVFYRIKIKDDMLRYLYNMSINNEKLMNLLKYYIQLLVYVVSPCGIILGVNMYDGIDHIDVIISSAYNTSESEVEDNYNLKYATNIVQSYALKELIKKINLEENLW